MVSEKLPCALEMTDVDELGSLLCPRCGSGPCEKKKELRNAEVIARAFHEAYERLAPRYEYETRMSSREPWPDVPDNNRKLMIAVAQELIDRKIIDKGDNA